MSDLSKARLRLWVRLLRVTRGAENGLREWLRTTHNTTLPRFDVMAALYRRREGVTMSELSRMLLVSNGNATAVVDRLEGEGLVLRTPSAVDRRTVHVALTVDGSLATLLNQLFGAGIGPSTPGWPLLRITLAQAAPILPYLLLVLILIFRPKGLLGTREG